MVEKAIKNALKLFIKNLQEFNNPECIIMQSRNKLKLLNI